jgi:hypothetical protein
MKSLPVKQRPARLDLDKLIPLTKSKANEQNKQKEKLASNSKNKKTFKSSEMIDIDDEDNESVDPPSDTEATLHESSATLKGSGRMTDWFSQQLKGLPQQVKAIPAPDQIIHAEPIGTFLTPQAKSPIENDKGNPSTMTHLSNIKPNVSDYATSSSQLPYSSPVRDRPGRSDNMGVINPIPIRDKSSQIAHLQKVAHQGKLSQPFEGHSSSLGQSGQIGYDRKLFAAPAPYARQESPETNIITSFPEDDEDDIKEEQEEWSTFRKQSRYASKSMNRRDEYHQSSSKPITALFPQQGPNQQQQASSRQGPSGPSKFSKLTLFRPPSRPAQQSTGYTLAVIPNGARMIDHQQQHYVEEVQWTNTPRMNKELQNPKLKDQSWLRAAEAARPNIEGNWKDEWMQGPKPKRDITNNSLGKYALKDGVRRSEVDGQGRAFRL